MEALKTWGISTCAVLIIASLISMIVPNISHKNIMRVIISTFILAGILHPFTKLTDSNFNTILLSNTLTEEHTEIEYSREILNNLEQCAVTALYPLISEKLEEYNIDEFGLNVCLESKKDGVKIKYVNITVYEPHINITNDISSKIADELGLEIYVSRAEGS